jgi:hypothetical protein
VREPSIEKLLIDQEQSWKSGNPFYVEVYLAQHSELRDNRDIFFELLLNEICHREAQGEKPDLEEYRRSFPAFQDELEGLFTLLAKSQPSDRTPSQGASRSTFIIARLSARRRHP